LTLLESVSWVVATSLWRLELKFLWRTKRAPRPAGATQQFDRIQAEPSADRLESDIGRTMALARVDVTGLEASEKRAVIEAVHAAWWRRSRYPRTTRPSVLLSKAQRTSS
jgi:hypothetical protein